MDTVGFEAVGFEAVGFEAVGFDLEYGVHMCDPMDQS